MRDCKVPGFIYPPAKTPRVEDAAPEGPPPTLFVPPLIPDDKLPKSFASPVDAMVT